MKLQEFLERVVSTFLQGFAAGFLGAPVIAAFANDPGGDHLTAWEQLCGALLIGLVAGLVSVAKNLTMARATQVASTRLAQPQSGAVSTPPSSRQYRYRPGES